MSVLTLTRRIRQTNADVIRRLGELQIGLWDEARLEEDDPAFAAMHRLKEMMRRNQDGLDELEARLRGAGLH